MTDTEKTALERRIDELCAEAERLKGENAKLVDVLHEVEQEAIYAYNCLQRDCEAVVGGQTHFFNKWWHAECECDRAKSQNAKLQELAKQMHMCLTRPKVYDGEQPYLTATECPYFTEGACDYNACGFERRMRDLGIEVPDGEV